MEHSFSRNSIVDALTNNICEVEFVKTDGSSRQMKCTLLTEYLPEQQDIEEYTQPKSTRNNQDNVVVFDIEAGGWRTFNVTRVTEFNIVESNVSREPWRR